MGTCTTKYESVAILAQAILAQERKHRAQVPHPARGLSRAFLHLQRIDHAESTTPCVAHHSRANQRCWHALKGLHVPLILKGHNIDHDKGTTLRGAPYSRADDDLVDTDLVELVVVVL